MLFSYLEFLFLLLHDLTISCNFFLKTYSSSMPKSKVVSTIQPFNNLLSIYYVLSTLLTTGSTILNKSGKVSALINLLSLVKEIDINQISTPMKI